MKTIRYSCNGTCAVEILLSVNDDDTVASVEFIGGCPGNHAGIAALVKGMKRNDVIQRLKGITCRDKATSCPDQLARALESI